MTIEQQYRRVRSQWLLLPWRERHYFELLARVQALIVVRRRARG